ncbi:unnamed protein product [Rhizophagus irregularis]|nr:unnamed protein product [Rhizophagus irregularis]
MDPIVNLELTISIIDDDNKKTNYEISLSSEKKNQQIYLQFNYQVLFGNITKKLMIMAFMYIQNLKIDYTDILNKLVNWVIDDCMSDELQIDFKIIRCGAHSIALVVNAGLEKFKPIIDKVQAFIIEVRNSPKKEQKLITFATNLNIKYKKLIKDVTRWNTTLALVLDSQYKTQIFSNSVSVEDAKQLLIEKFNSY